MAALIGTGATVTFQTGLFAEILSANWTGLTREAVPSSHMGTTGGMTFIPTSLYDPGQLEVELILDNPNGGWVTAIAANGETVTLTFSNSDTWAASMFMSNFELSVPLEDRMTATATLKATGSITVT